MLYHDQNFISRKREVGEKRKRRNGEERHFQRDRILYFLPRLSSRNKRNEESKSSRCFWDIVFCSSSFASFPCFFLFLRLGESPVSRLQRFPAFLLSHPHRDSFFFSLNGRLLRYLFLSFSFVTSLSYYFISYSFLLPVIGIYCVVRLSRQREKKRFVTSEDFFVRSRSAGHDWIEADLPFRGKGSFPLSITDLSH